jgi:hypothetical protein
MMLISPRRGFSLSVEVGVADWGSGRSEKRPSVAPNLEDSGGAMEGGRGAAERGERGGGWWRVTGGGWKIRKADLGTLCRPSRATWLFFFPELRPGLRYSAPLGRRAVEDNRPYLVQGDVGRGGFGGWQVVIERRNP